MNGLLSDAIRGASVAETARIWEPYGVELTSASPSACGDVRLDVVVDRDGTPREGADGLGAIRFGDDGAPLPTVRLHYEAIVAAAMAATPMGLASRWWPVRLRDQVIARALGRTLAHEIGHFLLRSPQHARSGLMQARQHSSRLADEDAKTFGLSDAERARLIIGAGAWLDSRTSTDPTGTSSDCTAQ